MATAAELADELRHEAKASNPDIPLRMLSAYLEDLADRIESMSPGVPERQTFGEFNQSIAGDSSFHRLSWLAAGSGTDDLMDLTDPTTPFVKTEGFYLVHFDMECRGTQQAGKVVIYSYELDENDFDLQFIDVRALDGPIVGTFSHAISHQEMGLWIPTGGTIVVRVKHTTGSALDFTYNFLVQKLW